ncbi:MAG: NAD(P)-binding domain-containing protein, partial [Planctomycetaceae bacterium]
MKTTEPTATSDPRIAFIGAGRMATALARGLIAAKFTPAERVVACDVSPEAAARFEEATGARIAPGLDVLSLHGRRTDTML